MDRPGADEGQQEESLTSNAVVSAVEPAEPAEAAGYCLKHWLVQGPRFSLRAVGSFGGPRRSKRVGVIGTGCSAISSFRRLRRRPRATVFQRTAGWLAPTPDYHDRISDGKHLLLADVPFYQVWYRFFLFIAMADGPLAYLVKDPSYNRLDFMRRTPKPRRSCAKASSNISVNRR